MAIVLGVTCLAGCEPSERAASRAVATASSPQMAGAPADASASQTRAGAGRAPVFAPTRRAPTPDLAATASSPPRASDLARYTRDVPGDGPLIATVRTSKGTITCELFEDKTPIAVANFVGLARGLKAWTDPKTKQPQVGRRFYDGLLIHRVIPKFVIQGGDPTGSGTGGPGYAIPDELHDTLKYDRPGRLGLARPAAPHTGGSQFFITEQALPHLDRIGYTIFGQCGSARTIATIAQVPRHVRSSQGLDRPKDDVTIERVLISRSKL